MNTNDPDLPDDVDPIDREAATIDARDDDAPDQIAELVEHADELDRDVDSAISPSPEN